LWRDSGGMTSLELALTFPIIMVFILGGMELDRAMYLQLQMQGAVSDTSRYGYTGNASGDAAAQTACPSPYGSSAPLAGTTINTQYEVTCRLVEDLCPLSLAPNNQPLTNCPFDITKVNLSVYSYPTLQDQATNTAETSEGVTLANAMQVYNISYSLPFATGALNHVLGNSINITANIIVYSEPFPAPATGS
jgi:Flp pilus assembly protein TadG